MRQTTRLSLIPHLAGASVPVSAGPLWRGRAVPLAAALSGLRHPWQVATALKTGGWLAVMLLLCGLAQGACAADATGPADTARQLSHRIARDAREFGAKVAEDSKQIGHAIAVQLRQVSAEAARDAAPARRRIAVDARRARVSIEQSVRAAKASIQRAAAKAKAAFTRATR